MGRIWRVGRGGGSALARSLAGFALAALVLAAAAQDEPEDEPSPQADGAAAGAADGSAAAAGPRGLAVISRVLPVGKPHRDVVYPVFEGKRLSTIIRASEMARRDDQHLDFGPMRIEMFGAGGRRDYEVDLKSAVYYLESEQLSSDEESLVTSESFTLRGDAVVFDVLGRIAVFRGNVRMVIHDPSALAPSAPEPAATTEEGGGGEASGTGKPENEEPPSSPPPSEPTAEPPSNP